ncbi:MAG: hypothetical protein IJK08_00535 [Prevotella sp.]|jgi:hypothetical protein|nr:hypothetical protein [Prevotella sp.]
MLKIRQIILLCTLVALCACNSDKKRIQTYIDNFHPDSEIELDGDVVVDSTFCPLAALDSASLVLLSHRMNLLSLLDVNPDSAFALARQLNQKYNDSSFANIAYPKGPNNCLSYQVKCVVDGRERYVVFFKNANEDVIESSSIEVDEAVDSLMSSFTMLRNGLQIILKDSKAPAETKKKADSEKREKASSEEPQAENASSDNGAQEDERPAE